MDTIILNNGGHWDPVNHHFVAPQSGAYLFTVSMACHPGITQGMFLGVSGKTKLYYKCGDNRYNRYTTTGTFGMITLEGTVLTFPILNGLPILRIFVNILII